ncbi:MAG: histidine phosphatase family protein [Polyangiaceae bacterium]
MVRIAQPETLRDLRQIEAPRLVFMAHGLAENQGARNLSPDGRVQVARVSATLRKRLLVELDGILVSPLPRARQTALIASHALRDPPLPIAVDERLALGDEGPSELMRSTQELARASTAKLIVTCALEIELMACGLCAGAPGRRRIPSEATLPRGLAPGSVVALGIREGHWRISAILDGRAFY